MAPRIIGFVQSKGGVGKTTTALNVAAELTRRGSRVVLVDADPAGSARMVSDEGKLPYAVVPLLIENEDDDKAIATWARGVRKRDEDFVLIDAPGVMGAAFGATIAVADLVLVPSGATVLDVRGAAETIGIIRRHRRTAKLMKPDILVIPSRVDKRTSAGRDVVETLAGLTEPVAPVVSYRAVVADSLAAGETVPIESQSATEFGALVDAVMVRLGVE